MIYGPSLGPGMVAHQFQKMGDLNLSTTFCTQKSPGMIFQEGMQAAHSAKFLTWPVDSCELNISNPPLEV